MHRAVLYALSFYTNAVILVIEISGGRLLAPYIGTSASVWASLIAVVLGGMAVGYHLGGRLGDRDASTKNIGLLLAMAGMAALISWSMRDLVPTMLDSEELAPAVGALVLGVLLFMPTVILIAAVSPMLAKNLIRRLEESAGAVGSMSAIGTMGAIAGAVATGIILIPSFGVGTILLAVALSLICTGLVLQGKNIFKLFAAVLCVIAGALALNALPTRADGWLAEISSAYSRIVITEDEVEGIWTVSTSPFGVQCQMYVDAGGRADETRLAHQVLKAHDALIASLMPGALERSLFLGGCVAAFPRYFMREHPNMKTDLVEIDSVMTAVAREYFSFDPLSFPALSVKHEDARTFINKEHLPYDVVYVDAFDSSGRVPFHLVTEEMFERLAAHTKKDGLLIMNTYGTYEGPGIVYPAVFVKTARSVFRHVALYRFTESPFKSQNLVIAASNERELPDTIADPRYPDITLIRAETPQNVITLTDDYAPVEGLLPTEKLYLSESE